MEILTHILLNNIIPLFILVSVGIVLQKTYSFDIKVFSKLNFVVFGPAIIFAKLYEIKIELDILWKTVMVSLLLITVLYLITVIYTIRKNYLPERTSAIINSILYFNSGNYGLPLVLLVFPGDSLAFSVQLIVMTLQTILPFTLGVITINARRKTRKELLVELLRTPIIIAIVAGLCFRFFNIGIPESFAIPLSYITDGFMAMALMTLGIQLANINWSFSLRPIIFTNTMRLLVSPLVTILIVNLLNITGTIAQVLIISSALPTALNVVLLAIEYDSDSDFASQVVLTSTIMSIFTLTGLIALVKVVI